MAVQSETGLVREIGRLRAQLSLRERELAQRRHEAAARERQLERYAADLSETFKQERTRSQQLRDSYMATVRALCNAVEARDAYTARHAERVAAYGLAIARPFADVLGDRQTVEFGFLLHDIGKLAVPDAVLYKPDVLTPAERAVVSEHPVVGARIVQNIEFLAPAAAVIRSHHERWDGHGYPDALAGEQIPLAARVFAVADVLDALTTDRPYRRALPLREARAMIEAEAGRHFDPAVIEAFAAIGDDTIEQLHARIG